MKQVTTPQEASRHIRGKEQLHERIRLGLLLCWTVVFADVGTSIYYVPGILHGTVGNLAGFFVMLTMSVFVLLTLKYAEVTHRFPQGGGVVTVAAQAMNHWVGALGGMFILVDYFLTAAISCLSGMLYLSLVVPALVPFTLEMSIVVLLLFGLLNWFGVSESAKVSLVGALIAFLSDIALLLFRAEVKYLVALSGSYATDCSCAYRTGYFLLATLGFMTAYVTPGRVKATPLTNCPEHEQTVSKQSYQTLLSYVLIQ